MGRGTISRMNFWVSRLVPIDQINRIERIEIITHWNRENVRVADFVFGILIGKSESKQGFL